MIKNYITLAWRNIKVNKVLFLLNILGLTSGLFCFLLIYLWISSENSINRYHENIDQLHSIYLVSPDGTALGYGTSSLLYKELKSKIPEVEKITAMTNDSRNSTFSNGHTVLKQNGKFVSEDYFEMFSFEILEGNASNALTAPNHIAVSKEMAELFFGNSKGAIGKTLTYENSKELEIAMVYELSSEDSTEKSDYYLPFEPLFAENEWMHEWKNLGTYTFVQLAEGTNVAQLEQKLKPFLKNYELDLEIRFQSYADSYLFADIEKGEGKIIYVRMFGIIAFLIMLIASINFMNLASAGYMKRAKEIGTRKVLGASKSSLILQFLGEAMLLSFISLFFALIFIAIALPVFNDITEKNIDLLNLPVSTWVMVFLITLLTGFLSGSYPAFLLSSFSSTDLFKKIIETSSSTKWIRKGLVVFQFTISVVFISSMLIISKQIDFVQDRNIGFDRGNLLAITLSKDLQNNFDAFKSGALQISGVQSVTKTSHIPLGDYGTSPEVVWNSKSADDRSLFTGMVASTDFVGTYGVELLMGRELIHNNPENIEYLINETAMNKMKMENPIGQPLSFWGNPGTIVGVVKDFHFGSLKETIFPMIIRSEGYSEFNIAFVKYSKGNEKQTLAELESLHNNLNPAFPFEYRFIDQEYDKLYKSESMFYKLSTYFSVLAILISCLGLFGLVLFTAEQKTKEIGIRKVLGASVFTITSLITRDFLKLILVGVVIGTPISSYFMIKWLEEYEYRIHMPWWVYGLTAVLIIGISLLTVGFESLKAATAKPLKSLRDE
ncbi:ABC transporter permease [Maribacter stanieri]|uniref:ABC transporter permease n=1 Tax=Maribacter stanieri TaxID=440514 RepID=UPI002494B765|nr:FtsX-like permease family protein [Maribacter stanieri]|tara:strand:+ start:3596 stop:5932 length:2337 start_codon:yes stop_codon:yes gene_type:complete